MFLLKKSCEPYHYKYALLNEHLLSIITNSYHNSLCKINI